jgi:hypothetical protein
MINSYITNVIDHAPDLHLHFSGLALFAIMIFSLIPLVNGAYGSDEYLPKISLSGLQVSENALGNPGLEIQVLMRNQEDELQQYLAIIEVRDSTTGISESLHVVSSALNGFESTSTIVSWTPAYSGIYELRAFAVRSFQDLEILSPMVTRSFTANIDGGRIAISYTDEPFTIILIPDTQRYWTTGNEEIAYNQTKWIVENKDKLNIQTVVHLGDIVDNPNVEGQWIRADRMMKILDNDRIPYIALVGNHDVRNPYSSTERDYTNFQKYFPDSRIIANQTLQTEKITSNGANMYAYLTVGENEFLIVSMEYCPTLDVIEQVNEVIREHKDKRVILATHAFLRSDGTWTSVTGGGVCTKIQGTDDYSTVGIWELVVYPNPNIFLVVSGHSSGESKRVDANIAGKPVQQIVIDHQSRKNGGDGLLKLITFDPSEDKIYFETYSPWLDSYETKPRSKFSFDYDMQ